MDRAGQVWEDVSEELGLAVVFVVLSTRRSHSGAEVYHTALVLSSANSAYKPGETLEGLVEHVKQDWSGVRALERLA